MVQKKTPPEPPRRPGQPDADLAGIVAAHGAHYFALLAGAYKDEMALLACRQPIKAPKGHREKVSRASQLEVLSDLEALVPLTMIWKESRWMRQVLPKAGQTPLFEHKIITCGAIGTWQHEMYKHRIAERTEDEWVDDGLDDVVCGADGRDDQEIAGDAGAEPEEANIEAASEAKKAPAEPSVFDKEGLGPPTKNAMVMRVRRLLDAAEEWRLVTRHRLEASHVEIRGTERLHRLMLRVYAPWVGAISLPGDQHERKKAEAAKKKPMKKRRNLSAKRNGKG